MTSIHGSFLDILVYVVVDYIDTIAGMQGVEVAVWEGGKCTPYISEMI